jgi:hypothetical protein
MVCDANQFGGQMHGMRPETAAASYSYLRGLFLVPLGLLLVLSALANAETGPFRWAWAFPVAAAACGAAALLVQRHYREHYGRMTPTARQGTRDLVAVGIAVAVMTAGALLLRSRASWSLDLPVNAIAVAYAVVMLVHYGMGASLRTHHVVLWGAVLIAGALPVWDGGDPSLAGLVIAGVATVASGLLDHRVFFRTFGPPDALDRADAGA